MTVPKKMVLRQPFLYENRIGQLSWLLPTLTTYPFEGISEILVGVGDGLFGANILNF